MLNPREIVNHSLSLLSTAVLKSSENAHGVNSLLLPEGHGQRENWPPAKGSRGSPPDVS
ncbi:MAG: hypothetical protein ACK4SY_10495 [Pyrobaculum sp.]